MTRYLLAIDDVQIEDLTDVDLQRIRDCCDVALAGEYQPEPRYIDVLPYEHD